MEPIKCKLKIFDEKIYYLRKKRCYLLKESVLKRLKISGHKIF